MHRRLSKKYGIQIPRRCKIGYGFYIGHGIGIVINGGTVIGNNVNISQFLTIGSNKGTPAVIGDNVYIGATVAGVPAKVISYKEPGRFIKDRYVVEE